MRPSFWACAIVAATAACQAGSPAVVDEDASVTDAPDPVDRLIIVVDAPPTDTPVAPDKPVSNDTPAVVDGPASDIIISGDAPPVDTVAYTGSFGASSGAYTLTVGGRARAVRIHVPPGASASAPLVIAYHGTNGAAADFESETRIDAASDALGFIAAIPQAEERQGNPADADHQSRDLYAAMWDITDRNPASNRDLLLTRAIILESRRALRVDDRRVYLMGHSNGGFFAYHAAATIASRVAGFATSCAGVIRCGYRVACAFSAGVGTTCAALSTERGFCPQVCAASMSYMAPLASPRMPRAYIAHGNRDDLVSVSFSCALAREMGSRAEVQIVDGLTHSLAPDFVRSAWSRLSGFTVSD